jgi:RNA polymerase sigma-70 factor (ECF subfamily)
MEDDRDSAGEAFAGPDVTTVFVANHRAFLSFLERRVGSRAVAEDLLQEAFVRGAEKIKADNEQSIIAWFYEALRNAAVDYHRRSQTSTKALAAFAAETADRKEPDEDLRSAVCQCVRRLADTLKPDFATAIRRVEVDGIAVKDYAADAGISAGNAAVRLFRAREALRKQVTRSCGSCAEHGCLDCTCGGPTHQIGRAKS